MDFSKLQKVDIPKTPWGRGAFEFFTSRCMTISCIIDLRHMADISDTASAATLAITNARPFLIGNKNGPMKADWDIEPANGFIWPEELLSAAKGHIVNDFMCCFRGRYTLRAAILSYAECSGSLTTMRRWQPQHWEIWRALSTQSALYRAIAFLEWMAIVDTLEIIFIKTRIDLAVPISSLGRRNRCEGRAILLWKSPLWWKENPIMGNLPFARGARLTPNRWLLSYASDP